MFNLVSGTNETRCIEWHETCKCKYRFNSSDCYNKQPYNDAIINNLVMMINAGVHAKNWLIKAYAIKDLFRILVIVSVNVINPVVLVSILTIKI